MTVIGRKASEREGEMIRERKKLWITKVEKFSVERRKITESVCRETSKNKD